MKKWFLLLVGIGLLLTGCGKGKTYEPVKINPEIDVCELCNMSIAHEHHATELLTKEGDVYKFDDIVCMFEFVQKEKAVDEEEIAKQFVRDLETGDWVELEKAYYVYDPEIWTPMANGVVSFKDKESAQKYIEKEGLGELYNYEQLLKHPWEWYK